MKYVLTAGVALALLATPAAAQSISESTGVNAALGIAPSTQDFVTKAASSDMLEISSSKLVDAKADTKDQAFAKHMIDDHSKTTEKLKQLVDSGKVKVDLPTAMDKTQQSTLDRLQRASGEEFRKQYEDMQVSAHKDAVSLFQRYAKGGDNADLKAFAAATLPTLQDHLKMAKDLDK